jgi:alkanesulfonate monooxygenase SsuD/methylene tetrahydromethanopterin reductase-like flavin-dependent oxidoreductase (luciferase family)
MRLVWSRERSVRFDGEIYTLKGLKPGPHPAHEIGIWVGAGGPRMLGLTGRLANGWVPSMGWATPDRLPEMHRRIDEGAEKAEREPMEIRRAYNISGMIGETGDAPLVGSPSRWVEQLSRFALEFGMDTFIYWPAEDHARQVELFAGEVVPGVRETVAAERGR